MYPLLAQQPVEAFLVVVVLVAIVIVIALLLFFFSYGFLYIKALLAGAHVGIFELVGMRLRGVRPSVIVDSRIMAIKAGLRVETVELETHYLARGNVPNVVRALIAASKANIPLTFNQACAIDLAGRDVLDAVQTSVNPKVIDCPDPTRGRDTVAAVAKDGIQVKAKARVTVRANLERLV
ncbi:MAG: flotillin-like FloA family protein, partial [Planctomycetota bacterium]